MSRDTTQRTLALVLIVYAGTLYLAHVGRVGEVVYGWLSFGLTLLGAGKWAVDRFLKLWALRGPVPVPPGVAP